MQSWQSVVSFLLMLVIFSYWLGSYALYGSLLEGDIVLAGLAMVLLLVQSLRLVRGAGRLPRQPLLYGLALSAGLLLLTDIAALTLVFVMMVLVVAASQMDKRQWWIRTIAIAGIAAAGVSIAAAVIPMPERAWHVAVVGMLAGLPVITGYLLSERGTLRWSLAYGLVIVGLCVAQDWGVIILLGLNTLYLLGRVGLSGGWQRQTVIIGAPLVGLLVLGVLVRIAPAMPAQGRVAEILLRDRAGRILPTEFALDGEITDRLSVSDNSLTMVAPHDATLTVQYPVSLPDNETIWLQFEIEQPPDQWVSQNTVVHFTVDVVFRQGFRERIFAYRHAPARQRDDQQPQVFAVDLTRYEGRSFSVVLGVHSERTTRAEAQWRRMRLVGGLDTPLSEIAPDAITSVQDSDIPALYGVLLNPARAVERRVANWRYTLAAGDRSLTSLPRLNDGTGFVVQYSILGGVAYIGLWLLLLWQVWRGFGSAVNRAFGTGIILLMALGLWSGVLLIPPLLAVMVLLAGLWRADE